MSSQSSTKRLQAFWDTLTIIVFLGLLWLPTLDHFFKLDHAEAPGENRLPAKWPAFKGLGQSRDFITGVESYFNDHFGFRKRLVRLHNHWKVQLFRDPGSKDVLIGRDGWLYYSGDRMIAHYTSTEVWSQQDLENWRRLLERRRDWLAARGAKYLLALAPDKHRVYSEYLPDWLERGAQPGKVQQLVDYMKAHSTVEVLDLTQVLMEAKKTRVDYLQTDTHWNMFGGFVSYRAMVEALSRQLPGLTPLPLDTFSWKPGAPQQGDLARILGRPEAYPEKECVTCVALKPFEAPKVLYDPVRFPHQGPQETRPCYTLNPEGSGKAMVFHDSFACAWYGFLGQHFREVVYVWQYEWNAALIEREKPDVVIDQILERFFNVQDPLALARKDQLSETKSAVSGL
jgi:alginate O-acetyltransferase complex protein AlgJ